MCAKVIEVNKKMKGRQINILPLSFIRKQPIEKKNYPINEDCFSLLNEDWIKIKPHSHGDDFQASLVRLIANTFNRHMLVKDYELGLSVSKEYHLNCITADKEIIYSDGYLCKLGK